MEDRITGGNSKRRVRQRQEQAIVRQELRWQRSPKEQLRFLDEKLGKDVGAVKERTRLLESILATAHKEVDKKIETETKSNEKKTKARLSPKEIKQRRKQHKKANA